MINLEYFIDNNELIVYSGINNLHYYNSKIIEVKRFDNGNLVVLDESSVTLITSFSINTISNVKDIIFNPKFIMVMEKRNNTICASLFNPNCELICNLYLVDSSYWVHITSIIQLCIPIGLMRVTGFKDGKLYGSKGHNTCTFDIDTKIYRVSSKECNNIIEP